MLSRPSDAIGGIGREHPTLKGPFDEGIGVNLTNGMLNDIYKCYNGITVPEQMPT